MVTVPQPPVSAVQAGAWVAWAIGVIGDGFHPDTSGVEYVGSDGTGPMGATCSGCGEHFVPNDEDDTIHIVKDNGDECGKPAAEVGRWGNPVPLFTPAEAGLFDRGLSEAADILNEKVGVPDIYETSIDLMVWLDHIDFMGRTPA
jgi:hypothetical protein